MDADDVLLPTAAATVIEQFNNCEVSKVHWPMWVINNGGEKTGEQCPTVELLHGNLKDLIIEKGPYAVLTAPTSGNAWARSFLEEVLPIPTADFKI